MAREKQAAVVEIEVDALEVAAPTSILDQILDTHVDHVQKVRIPEGYALLEGGVERHIRVNRDWIQYGYNKPFIVVTDGEEAQYEAVIFVAMPELVASEERGYGCAPRTTRACFIKTTGPLLVKP